MGNKVDSVELDDETVKVDLRGNDMGGERERCSSVTGDLLLVIAKTPGEHEGVDCEDLETLGWECGSREICCGEAWSATGW